MTDNLTKETKADIVIATIQANEQQVIAERELARVIGCDYQSLQQIRREHADRFTVMDADKSTRGLSPLVEKSAENQQTIKDCRLVVTLKIQAEDGKMRLQTCYSPKAALEVCRHLRRPVADEVMDKLYELAEQKPIPSGDLSAFFTDPDTIMTICQRWKADREKLLAAEKQIAADTPFTLYGKQVGLDGDYRLNEGVQVVGKFLRQNGCLFGQTGLAQYLEDHHYAFRNGDGELEPRAEYCRSGNGLFWMKQTPVNVPVSEKYPTGVKQRRELRFTTRGKMYFLRKLCPPVQTFPKAFRPDSPWSLVPPEAGGRLTESGEIGAYGQITPPGACPDGFVH